MRRLVKVVAVLVVLGGLAWADSVPLAVLQNGGADQVLLGPDLKPQIEPTFHGQLAGLGDVLCFSWTFTPETGQSLSWFAEMLIGGQVYGTAGFVPVSQAGGTYVGYFAFTNLPAFYHGADGWVDLHFDGGDTGPLWFNCITPVPEPSEWLLLVTGLLGLGAILLSRRQKSVA